MDRKPARATMNSVRALLERKRSARARSSFESKRSSAGKAIDSGSAMPTCQISTHPVATLSFGGATRQTTGSPVSICVHTESGFVSYTARRYTISVERDLATGTHAVPGPHAEQQAGLNGPQRAAAEHPAGPLLVIAGAGTGKTKTLAARVAALVRAGVAPGRILLLTFTRRAAGEMLRRAAEMVGETAAAGVWGGTFHATAHRLLRMYSGQLGLEKTFVVMDQGDAEDLLNLLRADLNLHRGGTRFPQKGTLLAIYSRCVNAGEPLEQVLKERFPWCFNRLADVKRVFQEYTQRKSQQAL